MANSITNDITNFWNTLTGQAQEDARTDSTNQMNLQAVQDTNQANRDIAKETNATNLQIAQENLGYQRELQEYNKALQQQIFEREDTSYERTARDMRNAGLNPLAMQGTNGAGEAIAQSPLNNSFQAQTGAPMQAPQFQKANTMMSPIQALGQFSSVLGTVINSVESIKNGVANRDALRKQTDLASINSIMQNIDKGVIYDESTGKFDFDKDTFEKYLTEKAKEKDYNIAKMKHDMREWEHFENSGKYESDTDFEKMITAVTDWLTSGRAKEQWDKLKETFPILNIVDSFAQSLMQDEYIEVNHNGKKTRTYTERSSGRKYRLEGDKKIYID